jgi:transposase-like protein
MKAPKTFLEAVRHFANADICSEFMVDLRWPDGVIVCPHCGSDKVTHLKNARLWKCHTPHPRQKFSVKVGTILEDSPIGLEKWLPAMWLAVNCKNGISSYEIARDLGVTQKTAWFMLHRIRLSMQDGIATKMKGRVEADETFIGAKARNMHLDKRLQKGTGTLSKTAVLGLLERETNEKPSRVRCKVMKGIRVRDLDPEVRANIEKGAEVITDSHPSYYKLADDYIHNVIDHAISYAEGHVHTNGLENFWSLLKRAIKGTYVNVEPFHLFRYLDEQAFRFNERKSTDFERFKIALQSIVGRRLTYQNLTGQSSERLTPCPTVAG